MTNVLIGDSMARPIKPDLVFPGGQSQNISVSGLAIDDVNHWLANIPRNREERRVVIHIGINTCKFAVVTESMWRQLPCWCLPSFLPWGDLGRLYRSPTQCSWQCATGRRCRLSIIPTPSLPGAVRHGSTFTETNFTPVTVARAGWCSTSSLLQVPSIPRLTTTCQALALNKEKTRHSPSSNRKESSNTMRPDLCCWDLRHPVLSLMHNITGLLTGTPASGREQQHHGSGKRTFSVLPIMSDVTPL